MIIKNPNWARAGGGCQLEITWRFDIRALLRLLLECHYIRSVQGDYKYCIYCGGTVKSAVMFTRILLSLLAYGYV